MWRRELEPGSSSRQGLPKPDRKERDCRARLCKQLEKGVCVYRAKLLEGEKLDPDGMGRRNIGKKRLVKKGLDLPGAVWYKLSD